MRLLVSGAIFATAVVFITGLVAESTSDRFGWDFRYQYFAGAEAVVHGHPLYGGLDSRALAQALEHIRAYVYPPLVAVVLTPLTPLSADAATVLMLLASLGALAGTLAVLGVRDPRCYAIFAVWPPVIGALVVLNVTPLLALALGVVWRYRATCRTQAWVLGFAVSAKLLLWPVLVWQAATRRSVAVLSVGVALAATAATWAVVGFEGLFDYPGLVRRLDALHAANSYSFVGMTHSLGGTEILGQIVGLTAGSALLALCYVHGRRGNSFQSFTLAVVAVLALSPIVWLHYLTILVVPLAIARPRLSPLWFLPLLMWVNPKSGYADGWWVFAPALLTAVVVLALLASGRKKPAATSSSVTDSRHCSSPEPGIP